MIAIVIPTYNEALNIENLIKEILSLSLADLIVIVVDDNSPDGTAVIAERVKKRNANWFDSIFVIKRLKKMGLGSAYVAGFKKALELGADYIFEMDADFSHDPQDIPVIIEKAQNYDLVIGSRKIKGGKIIGWNWHRKLMSAGAMFVARLFLQLKPKDVTAGFRCYHRSVLQKINLNEIKSNGYAFQEEMLYRVQNLGFKIAEVPVIFRDRRLGKSKLSKKDIIEFFALMLKLKFGK